MSSVNKYLPHVYVIPEDDADRQIANGFVLHDQVRSTQIQVLPCTGGWSSVLEKFATEYVTHLRNHKNSYVIMLVDFDLEYETRRKHFEEKVPDDLKNRVFVVGPKDEPEVLRQELGSSYEDIGESLAEDCFKGTVAVWDHDHLNHNHPDLQRMLQAVRPILFPNQK
ncbi:MAG: hypothetical protein WCH39_03810 [Schlesneria sp.]